MHIEFWYGALGKPRRSLEDNIKMCTTQTGWEALDWTDLAQDREKL
jgi:hypothetical protein